MGSRGNIRALLLDATLILAIVASLLVTAHPQQTAELLGLPDHPWANRLFDGGLAAGLVALACLAVCLVGRLGRAGGRWSASSAPGALARGTRGTVMVEFALVFPLMLLVAGMIVQLALIANASIVVRYAAYASARTATVELERKFLTWPPFDETLDLASPTDPHYEIDTTAHLILASISPDLGGTNAAGRSYGKVLNKLAQGRERVPWDGQDYQGRMQYAIDATTVAKAETYAGTLSLADFTFLFDWLHQGIQDLVPDCSDILPIDKIFKPIDRRLMRILADPTIEPFVKVAIVLAYPAYLFVKKKIIKAIGNAVDLLCNFVLDPLKLALADFLVGIAQQAAAGVEFPNFFAPKQVEVTVEYDFLITIPGISLVPLVTKQAPGGGRAFPIRHSVVLQSTGTRNNPFSLLGGKPSLGEFP